MFARIALVFVVGFVLWAVFARDTGASGKAQSYRVHPGETLWAIASRNYAGDPREGVWKLQRRNHLTGTTIVPGQVLVLP